MTFTSPVPGSYTFRYTHRDCCTLYRGHSVYIDAAVDMGKGTYLGPISPICAMSHAELHREDQPIAHYPTLTEAARS